MGAIESILGIVLILSFLAFAALTTAYSMQNAESKE